jgi:hypothetical protein
MLRKQFETSIAGLLLRKLVFERSSSDPTDPASATPDIAVHRHVVPTQVYEIRLAVGVRTLNAALALIFIALLCYAAALTLPIEYTAASIGLDASWAFGLNYIAARNLTFGKDVLFTYGPLGYIAMPHNIGINLAIATAVRLLVWLVILWQLVVIYRNGLRGRAHAFVYVTAVVAANKVLIALPEYMFIVLLILLVHRLFENPHRTFGLILLAVTVSFLCLFKFSAYIVSLAIAITYAGWRLLSNRFQLRIIELVLLALAIVGGPLAFLAYEPSWSSLRAYFHGSMQFAIGYSEVMSLPTPSKAAFFLLALTAIFCAALGYAAAKRLISIFPAMLAVILYFFAFKHGFVRSDEGHLVPFYAFSFVLFAYLLCQLTVGLRQAAGYGLGYLVFGIICMAAIGAIPGRRASWWSPREVLQKTSLLTDWNEIGRRLDVITTQSIDLTRLIPSYLPLISGRRVTILPYELSYGATGQVDLEPAYVLQSYSAFTNWLDLRMADRFRTRDSIDYVLLEWKTVDNRHPAFDTPATWASLYENYQPVSHTANDLLLARRAKPVLASLQEISTTIVEPGAWVEVPRRNHAVSATISMPLTSKGRVVRTVKKIGAVYIHCEVESGLHLRFRVPPDVLQYPFMINAVGTNAASMWDIWREGRSHDRVVRIKLTGEGVEMYRTPAIAFFEDPRRPIDFDANRNLTLSSRFGVASYEQVASDLVGYVDTVGGVPWTANTPARVRTNNGLDITGWLATSHTNGSALDEVFAVVRGALIRSAGAHRPDVAIFLKSPRLENSGFRVHIPGDRLVPGNDSIYLLGYSRSENKLYKYPTRILIHVIE